MIDKKAGVSYSGGLCFQQQHRSTNGLFTFTVTTAARHFLFWIRRSLGYTHEYTSDVSLCLFHHPKSIPKGNLAPSSVQPEPGSQASHRRRSSQHQPQHNPYQHQHQQHVLGAANSRHLSPAAREQDIDSTSITHSSSDIYTQPMSLSRSPSPQRAGGWASPGLSNNFSTNSRSSTPVKTYSVNAPHNVTWASAQARSNQVNGYPAYQERGLGFFGKHMRKISNSLPFFNHAPQDERFAEKEKLGRGRWQPQPGGSVWANIPGRLGRIIWRMRLKFVFALAALIALLCFYATREYIPVSLSILYHVLTREQR